MLRVIVLPVLVVLGLAPVAGAADTWTADDGNGAYTNPLFFDEFSDPDVIRVGEDYYLTGTTMHTMPGLPVLHSRDLVNWRLLSYASEHLDLGPEYRLEDGDVYGQGIWAPSFRYHDGTFHIFTNVNGQTTQRFHATDPAGPWTRTPMKVSLHDLSVLFDDDGHAYAVWGYREIRFARLTDDLTDIVPETERVLIEADAGMGEGAHFYEIDGRYYIVSAHYDPVGYLVCARAERREGPYEVTTISADETLGVGVGRRLAGMGRGGPGFELQAPRPDWMGANTLHQGPIVQTPSGEWWGLSMMDHNSVGRLTCLSPVTWKDGWPFFGLPGNLLRSPRTWLKPDTGHESRPGAPYERNDDFSGPRLGTVWQWNHVADDARWSLGERPGFLRLHSLPAADFWTARNTLTQRAIGPESVATAVFDTGGMKPGDVGGLALLNYPYAWIGLTRSSGGGTSLEWADQRTGERESVAFDGPRVWLRAACDFDAETARLSFSRDGVDFEPLGGELKLVFQLRTFQGVRFALFHYNQDGSPGGYLDVDAFTVDEPRARRHIPLGKTIALTSRADGSRLTVWRGLLRALPADAPDAESAAARFRVVDRGRGRVALEAADGSGFVTVTGLGGTADVRLRPTLDEPASTFQWQHMLQGDTMLLSLATQRFLAADPRIGGLVTADSPGAAPDRRGGATFRWEVVEPSQHVARPEYFDLSDVRLLDGPFRHAQKLDHEYLLALEPDRLLAGFRTEAGLTPRAEKYPNWESSGLDGHTLGHYLTALAQMWAATADAELKRRVDSRRGSSRWGSPDRLAAPGPFRPCAGSSSAPPMPPPASRPP